MLPEKILKERGREANRKKRDRAEDNEKRKRKALEQQRELLEQGVLRCPRRAGARRARVHAARAPACSPPRAALTAAHAGATPMPSGPWKGRACR